MKVSKAYLLTRKNLAISPITKNLEEKHVEFKIIDVDENGIGTSLWRDYRTFDLPILVTKEDIIKGESAVMSFIEQIERDY
jgi:hypothetical protein